MDLGTHSESNIAPHACVSCRKNKRRCDKELPSCFLCVRAGRFCDYSYLAQVESSNAMNDLRFRVDELEHRVLQLYNSTPLSHPTTDLPAYSSAVDEQSYPNLYMQAFYLDSDIWSSSDITRQPSSIVPSVEVLAYLGNVNEIKREYFNSVHTWMPIISKMRLDRLTHSDLEKIRPDVALLLLCMKLVSHDIAEDEHKPSGPYLTAKKFSAALECDGLLTLRSLQASLLLTVYEIGHAIYPVAALTLGRCVKQGIALGLHNKDAPQLAGKIRSWVDWEERQRGWWMVVILDRFIVVGTSNQPLSTDDPSKDTILPSCEPAWDSGVIVPPVRVLLSSMNTDSTVISPFARLGQAANLLGRVIRHCNDTTADIEHVLNNAELLFGTIDSLLDILSADNHVSQQSFNVATAFCLSALFKLADHHSCLNFNQDFEMEVSSRVRALMQQALHTIEQTSERVLLFIEQLPQLGGQSCTNISPFHIHCIYSCAVNFAWMASETGNPEYVTAKISCENTLRSIKRLWKSAGVYLELLRLADASLSEEL